MQDTKMRVRFAPSPTGPFHIGGARSALFNWLLARRSGGQFVLRVEDTDRERSTLESERNIMEALQWLGINWDEGVDVGGPFAPYRQTERLDTYKEYTNKLLTADKAYPCFCTEEELDKERQEQVARGENPRYSGRCSKLTMAERSELLATGKVPAIRFRVIPHKQITFRDMVRGIVTFESDGMGDYVIVKSDGIPVYNYAVVIDDALMEITHVVRAEEHLSNTPRQILLYEALNLPVPEFGHVSLILGTDRTKMSKRHGATSVDQYRELGYLPEALVNFLVLLGWAPVGEQEIFSIEELIEQFGMDRVAKNPAVFDIDKLNYINAQYIKKLSTEDLLELCLPHLRKAGYVAENADSAETKWLLKMVEALRQYIGYGAQITEHAEIFFNDEAEIEDETAREILADEEVAAVLDSFYAKLSSAAELDVKTIKDILKSITKELKVGGKKVFMPIRVALTGKVHGPELVDIIILLGKERTISHMKNTFTKI